MHTAENPIESGANAAVSGSFSLPGRTTGTTGANRPGQPSGTGFVLVVEDEIDVRHLMTLVLQRAGYEVIGVTTLAEARAALSLHEFEATVIDLCLPDGRGDQIASLVRAQSPDTRIVVTSAFAHSSLMLQVAAESGDAFIPKPFRNSDLVAALEH